VERVAFTQGPVERRSRRRRLAWEWRRPPHVGTRRGCGTTDDWEGDLLAEEMALVMDGVGGRAGRCPAARSAGELAYLATLSGVSGSLSVGVSEIHRPDTPSRYAVPSYASHLRNARVLGRGSPPMGVKVGATLYLWRARD